MNPNFLEYFLRTSKASECLELEVIQSLWSGYGKISRYQLDGEPYKTVVVKHIALGSSKEHPRGWNTKFSHKRKVRSYEVESHWYQHWSTQCTHSCRVPELIGSFSEGADTWIILEDLNTDFPLRKYDLELSEIKVCLKWLAHFHAAFLNKKSKGLWDVGTYWHLETRPDEFEKIEHRALKSKAHLVDDLLNRCRFQTIVHGDAKLANFCFSENGEKVAAVDFQYVGGGCGMKDVAYFLGSVLGSKDCSFFEEELLQFYFSEMRSVFDINAFTFDFDELEVEWRKLYPLACVDFTRFLLGWMPTHQKINKYNLKMLKSVLAQL